jgi:hypothetical protein
MIPKTRLNQIGCALSGNGTFIVAALLLIVSVHSFTACASPTLEGHIITLRNAFEKNLTQPAVVRIFKGGKQSIPLLIDMIPKYRLWREKLNNPGNKNSPVEFCTSGFIHTYLVELILGRKSLEIKEGAELFLGSAENYVYWDGMIVKSKPNGPEVVYREALGDIHEIYKTWWQKNQHKSLRKLRAEWKKGIRPLSGSKYSWK